MKITKIEFIVYDADKISHTITTEKAHAIAVAKQINGRVCKRITTVEECEALDNEYTVWA